MKAKSILMFAIGPVLSAFLGLVTLPLITWFFSQEDVGKISMLHVAISFTTMVFCLGLDQSYVREYHESVKKARLFRAVWVPGSLLLLMTVILTVLLTNSEMSVWLYEIDSVHLTAATAIMILASLSSRFFSLTLRMAERGLAYSMSQVLPKVIVLGIIGGYVALDIGKTFENLLFANLVGGVATLIVLAWCAKDTIIAALKETIDYVKLKEMLSFGMPLVFGAIAYWGLTATDKIMLRTLSSYEELGLYSVAVSFASAATILQSVFSTVWAPTVYKWASKGEGPEKIYNVTNYMLLAVVTLFCLAGMFSWVVKFFLPGEYSDVQWILVACMGASLLYTLSETTVVGIGISRKSSYSMLASILAFLVNLTGNYLLVPEYGARGAAISTITAFYVFFILRTEFSSYLWLKIKRCRIYAISSVMVFIASLTAFYGPSAHQYFPVVWLLTFLVVLPFFKNNVLNISWIVIRKLRGGVEYTSPGKR